MSLLVKTKQRVVWTKWYRKIGIDVTHFSLQQFHVIPEIKSRKWNKDHLRYWMELIEVILTHYLFGVALYQAGTTPPNMLCLIERQYISQVPSTTGKPHAQRRCIRYTKRGIRRYSFFVQKMWVRFVLIKLFWSLPRTKRLCQGVARWWRIWLAIFSLFYLKFICLLVYIYNFGI